MGTLNIKRFLESNETSTLLVGSTLDTTFFKVNSGLSGVEYIYAQTVNNIFNKNLEGIINPKSIGDKCFLGVYDSTKGVLYEIASYKRGYSNYNIEGLEEKTLKLNEIKKEIESQVKNKIIDLIGFDESKLNLTEEEIKDAINSVGQRNITEKRDAFLLRGVEVDTTEYANYELSQNEGYILHYVKYIKEGEKYIDYLLQEHMQENNVMIYRAILELKEVIKQIKENENKESYIIRRKLNEFLDNDNYKTLNITYKENDNELTFKLDNRSKYYRIGDRLYNYNIKDAKLRKQFEQTFKGDIVPENIECITYSKKVLYTK